MDAPQIRNAGAIERSFYYEKLHQIYMRYPRGGDGRGDDPVYGGRSWRERLHVHRQE